MEKSRNLCNNPLNSCNIDHQLDIIIQLLGLCRGQFFSFYLCLIFLNKQLLLSFLPIELVLLSTLYKFIVWAYWAKTQSSYIGSNPNSVLTIGAVCGENLIYSESVLSTTFKMEEAGPHQVATGSHKLDANPQQAESRGSQHSNPCRSLERKGDREGSVHAAHTSKSQSRGKSHVSHAKNDRDMQCEIDELKRELYHAR